MLSVSHSGPSSEAILLKWKSLIGPLSSVEQNKLKASNFLQLQLSNHNDHNKQGPRQGKGGGLEAKR